MHQMFHQQHCSRWETAMTNWHSWALRSAALLLAGCGLLSARIYAQEQKATAPKSPSAAKKSASGAGAAAGTNALAAPRGQELTESDLSAFLDGFVLQQIEKADIAGAVIAVVKDGKVLFEKGYGYSDAEKKTPVSPQDTLFRPGSISKTFTWTAVMQQVEQGKLNLDTDVNQYLDFKIPPTFGKPTSLRDIMTHRSGLEETIKDLFVGSQNDLTPMAKYLPSHLPAQIFPPGTVPAYSNYATTLAAYMVQRVSGQPFHDYVQEHFCKSLNMTRATFRQPLPETLKPFMSNGYDLGSGKPKPFEWVEVAPAGSLSASAESMTHWMIMHLQNGRYGDAQILKPETAIQMHARQEGWPAGMNAMALGFYEQNMNGHRVIGHGGDTELFHSDMLLLPGDNVGLFVSYNSAGRPDHGDARGDLFQKVDGGLDRQIFNYVVIGFSVGVMVLTILLWPVAAILRKHYGKPLTLTLGDGARRWRRWVRVACFVDIAYLACLTLVLNALEKPGGLGSGSEWKLHLWQAIGVLGGIGALITIIAAIKSWGDEQQWVWYKIWNTLLAVGCVGFFWFLVHWHLLNFSLNY